MSKDDLLINKYNYYVYLTKQYIKKFNNIYYFFDKDMLLSEIPDNEFFKFSSKVSDKQWIIIGFTINSNELKYIVIEKSIVDENNKISYYYDLPVTLNINNTKNKTFIEIVQTFLDIK